MGDRALRHLACKRTSFSGFAELFFPFFSGQNAVTGIQRLDVQVSGRYDHYSDVGGTFNPKIGANWDPIRGITLRGSFGTSFHAPSLADAGTAIDTRVIRFADYTGSTTPGAYSIILAGGNKLKPETAHTFSLGADIKPVSIPGLKLSLTYLPPRRGCGMTGFPIPMCRCCPRRSMTCAARTSPRKRSAASISI
jgi:iron complex outermembrane receptor protein